MVKLKVKIINTKVLAKISSICFFEFPVEVTPYPPNSYQCTMRKLKNGVKVVNFVESFLCGFLTKIYQIWRRAASTPQKPT